MMRLVDLLLSLFILTLSDVLVVAGIFYVSGSWDLVYIWHITLFMYAVFLGYILSYYNRNIIPAITIFNFFFFQVEDILYMIFSTLLGWEPKPWLDPLFRWTWLDHTMSGYISRLIGFEGATTLGVILTSIMGLAVTVLVCVGVKNVKKKRKG